MRYEGVLFRPPSEADSLIIQATVGCPHNKCAFCIMYRQKVFKIRPVEEIKKDLDDARACCGDGIRSIFFADGNTIVIKTRDLADIFNHAYKLFPALKRITLYGSHRFVILKSQEELKYLKTKGLARIHCGLETGDPQVLKLINKGVTPEKTIDAAIRIKKAGIELSEYVMIGIGGKEMWKQHAINSAKVLNCIDPDFIRLRTFMPFPGSPLHDMYRENKFTLLRPYEALEETKVFIAFLKGIRSQVLSDHVSNYCNISGFFPHDKNKMLEKIDYALKESMFRPPEYCQL